MSAQSAKKKRLGSRRRGLNQNEKTKADEFQITDSTSEDQRHLTVDDTESLKVLAEPDNSLYETQSPSAFSGNRRKLGSSRKNKGHHETESCHETKEEVKETIATKQMSLTMQHVTEEVLIQESDNMSATHESYLYSDSEHDYFPELQNATVTNYPEADLDSVIPKSENLQTRLYENVTNSKIVSDSFTFVQTMEERVNTSETLYCEEDKESAHCVSNSELTRLSLASLPSVDHTNVREMSEQKLPDVCTEREKECKEIDDETELLRKDGNSQGNYLVSESVVLPFATTPEITTEETIRRENTENESDDEPATMSSPKEKMLTDEEQKPTEIEDLPQQDNTSVSVIHAATEESEIISCNPMDPYEIRDTNQCENVVKITYDSPTYQDISIPDNKQDEYLNEESIFEDLEQKNEDHYFYDTKEPPISDIEGVDSALGQVKEIEGQVQYAMKPSAEPKGHEEGLFSEMEEGESSSQAVQSGITVTSDSQPQQNIDFNPIGNRRKLGSSRRNKGRQHVKDSVAELYHEPAGEDSGNTRENTSLETELSLPIEPVVQEQMKETMLKGMEIFDTAPTEYVGELVKENSLVGISELTGSNVHAHLREDQKTNVQSNVGEMPEEEFPNVCTVTEKKAWQRTMSQKCSGTLKMYRPTI
ncbi:titin-like [Gymnodraco acuticeps]|uniref:Titin-like n=1 Tax=Gymnodraco acuticeps TaxID=8218 RepID=A0A6P8UDQ4_GYMAC|nr:titin-like [Gymnodraco acuticeps]